MKDKIFLSISYKVSDQLGENDQVTNLNPLLRIWNV